MKEINPEDSTREYAFKMWMNAPMPMVTLVRTLDVSRLAVLSGKGNLCRRLSSPFRLLQKTVQRSGNNRNGTVKFNMMMLWCIGKAASKVEEFRVLPVGDRLIWYDSIAVCTIVMNRHGEVSSCDIPFSEDFQVFRSDYLRLTRMVAETCVGHDLTESMVIGTSALVQSDIDMAAGMYSGIYNNPFMIWGKYRRGFFKTRLPVSFQFHHTQMDGAHAARFLDLLQEEIRTFEI
ncbi:MAG: CatA-like O-acetyltransferase, family 2 [Bacteroidales bacterium]|nr:CatA-like O-acetyltransferase, family 2 [Bacteroidales bacterium]MCM1146345.1 CatA-like O-acetyltransferase, family 2 [Bacteroidales bacterium]MCM1205217.1 CatA-like O-acetyltransferase, family 2 [Bacillota bacterium]MCM1509698.1 CatA-like O-acetyltransferase, family 2 [Clostridium sp.]